MDAKLLKMLAEWRKSLAHNILLKNPNISLHILNLFVKKIIICIIFLRIAEDNGVFEYNALKKLANAKTNLYHNLLSIFAKANSKYQSLFFEASLPLDVLQLDDGVLKELIDALYYPKCNYDFSNLLAEDLGQIYEESISHTFKIKDSPDNKQKSIIEEKGNMQKENGIYYTPAHIAQYIIHRTLSPLLENKNIAEATNIHIIDPSCGTGIFLLVAYRTLLDWHLEYYTNKDNLQSSLQDGKIEQIEQDKYQLSIKERTLILSKHIYGLDIDERAVEIAKISLYFQLLVDKKEKSKQNTPCIQHDYVTILKALKNNIKVGNALVASDFYSNKEISKTLQNNKNLEIKAFDWEKTWSDVFNNGGFDIVIGNPPYVSAENQIVTENLKVQRDYIKTCKRYNFLHHRWDIYIPFIEQGLSILKAGGVWSCIIPYAFATQLYAKKLREYILKNYNLVEIVSLKDTKVFSRAMVATCIPIIKKEKSKGYCQISCIDTQKNVKVAYTKKHAELVIDNINPIWNLEKEKIEISLAKNMYEMGDFCYISYGLRANSDEKKAKGLFKKKDLISNIKDKEHPRKYIEAKDISRYMINNVRYLEHGTKRSPSQLVRPTFPEWYEVPKIFIKLLGSLTATMDVKNNFLHDCSIIGGALWQDLKNIENKSISSSISRYSRFKRCEMEVLSKKVNLYYLLAIINSTYARNLINSKKGNSLSTYPEYIRHFPIPIAPPAYIDALTSFAKEELQLHSNLKDLHNEDSVEMIKGKIRTLDAKIDEIVYKIYKPH